MQKTTSSKPNKSTGKVKSWFSRRTDKRQYHALGVCRDDSYRDPSTLTFARMGLLAYRW